MGVCTKLTNEKDFPVARIAVMTSPAKGHLYPVVDTLLELQSRGHEIFLRTIPNEVERMNALGFHASPHEDRSDNKELHDWDAPSGFAALQLVFDQLAERIPYDCDEFELFIAETKPDFLLCDVTVFGAQLAAETSGLPWAVWSPTFLPYPSNVAPPYGVGMGIPRTRAEKAKAAVLRRAIPLLWDTQLKKRVNAVREEHGVDPLEHVLDILDIPPLIISYTAEPFEYSHPDWPNHIVEVGPGLWSPGPGEGIVDPTEGITDPIVLVTLSTEFQNDTALAQSALDGTGMHVVVTTGAIEPKLLRPNSNCTIVRLGDHAKILDHAALLIGHGGMGVTQKALMRSVPMVIVPFGRDQHEVAQRVLASGAGQAIPGRDVTPEKLYEKIVAALTVSHGLDAILEGCEAAGGAPRAATLIEERF